MPQIKMCTHSLLSTKNPGRQARPATPLHTKGTSQIDHMAVSMEQLVSPLRHLLLVTLSPPDQPYYHFSTPQHSTDTLWEVPQILPSFSHGSVFILTQDS